MVIAETNLYSYVLRALQKSVLSGASKEAKRRVLKTRHRSSKQRLNDRTVHIDRALSAVLTGHHAKAQLLHHSSEAGSGVTSATNMMAQYDQECEVLMRRLDMNATAQSAALAARLQRKRREMAERAVSMERLLLAQAVQVEQEHAGEFAPDDQLRTQ